MPKIFVNTWTTSCSMGKHRNEVIKLTIRYPILFRLRSMDSGYWHVVSYFTRSEAIGIINGLQSVKTGVGRGKHWLLALVNNN